MFLCHVPGELSSSSSHLANLREQDKEDEECAISRKIVQRERLRLLISLRVSVNGLRKLLSNLTRVPPGLSASPSPDIRGERTFLIRVSCVVSDWSASFMLSAADQKVACDYFVE